MLVHETIDLATLVATHARALLSEQRELPDDAIASLWSAARSRFDAWDYDLNLYRQSQQTNTQHVGERLVRLALEIETSEVLVRTLAALFVAHDAEQGRHHLAPIGHNLLAGQRHASRQLTELFGSAAPLGESAVRVNDFRATRAELHVLTDILVSAFVPFATVVGFGHNQTRVVAAGAEAADRLSHGDDPLNTSEVRITLAALLPRLSSEPINKQPTQQLAEAVIALFGPELFDSFGLLRSTWLRRMEQTSRDTQLLVAEWLGNSVTVPRW